MSTTGWDDPLEDTLDEKGLGRNLSPPVNNVLGKIVQLVMRWHCRLSHESAHTAMLTLSIDDAFRDPTSILTDVLSFVLRKDWEWEGHGSNSTSQGSPQRGSWKDGAVDLLSNHDEPLQTPLDRAALVLAVASLEANHGNAAFGRSVQGAFAMDGAAATLIRRRKCCGASPGP